MRKILIIGAGRSASTLIQYLLDKSQQEQLRLTIADLSLELAQQKANNHPNATAVQFDIQNAHQRQALIQENDIVVSMLPAFMHLEVAKDCLALGKNMVTASYVSKEMRLLDQEVKNKGLIFMNECGLDPGIDHMSAMKIIDEIKDKGGEIKSFESYCGGLVAPESDNNHWNYKFAWNPRNVVVAGQGSAAMYLEQGEYKYIPYNRLFQSAFSLGFEGYEGYEVYPNRDSLSYREIYGLKNVETMLRGTIRKKGYSQGWDAFVKLGITDDSYKIENSEKLTKHDFINLFLPYHPTQTVREKFGHLLNLSPEDEMWKKFDELELFDNKELIGLHNASPAQILESILANKWQFSPQEKDMVLMCHRIKYELNSQEKQIDSTMFIIGDDTIHTAMSKTVGLPLAIITLRILNGQIAQRGVQIPICKEVYEPVLKELASYNIEFVEKQYN